MNCGIGTEGGGYVQDEFVANKYFRLVTGARVDKFSSIDSAVFSPRVAFLFTASAASTAAAPRSPSWASASASRRVVRRRSAPRATTWMRGTGESLTT